MFKNQFNVYQYLDLKYCFHFSSQSLFSIFLIAASYIFSGSIYFFPSPTLALKFMDISSMFSYLCVSCFFYIMFFFVFMFANEMLLNKYPRQGLRLLLSFTSQDVPSIQPFYHVVCILQNIHVSQYYPFNTFQYMFTEGRSVHY